jgi:hypothetical protein
MRRLTFAITVLLCTLTAVGQGERSIVPDLRGIVNRGFKVTARSAYRHTLKVEQIQRITLEVDAKGSIRVKHYDDRSGVISECITVGGRIYHRWGNYPWMSQTKDEFEKAQVVLTAAIKEAKAKKETEAFQKAKAATLNNPAIFHALWRPTSNAIVASNSSAASEPSIAFLGNLPYKNKLAGFYRLILNTTHSAPPSFALRTEIVYTFDLENGALLKAQTRQDQVYESKTKTFFTTDEWEPDPSLVITPPVIGASKEQS